MIHREPIEGEHELIPYLRRVIELLEILTEANERPSPEPESAEQRKQRAQENMAKYREEGKILSAEDFVNQKQKVIELMASRRGIATKHFKGSDALTGNEGVDE